MISRVIKQPRNKILSIVERIKNHQLGSLSSEELIIKTDRALQMR